MERISELPNRPLVLDAFKMEVAYRDDDIIFLVCYTPRVGAPDDPTKLEFDVALCALDSNGETMLTSPRIPTLTIYDDPSASIQTPADHDPVQVILEDALANANRTKPWVLRQLSPTPLYERLAQS